MQTINNGLKRPKVTCPDIEEGFGLKRGKLEAEGKRSTLQHKYTAYYYTKGARMEVYIKNIYHLPFTTRPSMH